MRLPQFNFAPKIGIDLGTARVRIWVEGVGQYKDEPSCLSINVQDGRVLAVGNQALKLKQKNAQLVWPIQTGQVADKKQVQALLKILLDQAWRPRILAQPIIAVSIPVSSSKEEKQTLSELLFELGAQEVVTVAQPLAGMLGSGVLSRDVSASFGLAIGAGLVEAGVVSMGSVIKSVSNQRAGEWLSWQLQAYLHRELAAEFVKEDVEQLLQTVGALYPGVKTVAEVVGKDLHTGQPKAYLIKGEMLLPVVKLYAQGYLELVQKLMSQLSPALIQDCFERGLLIFGGAAKLQGLEKFLSQSLGMPVALVEDAETAVQAGLVVVLQNLNEFKNQALSA